ncbi:MAG TPA: hypothetical protein VMM35_03775 [Longimicrobiales bacterium]|nr:hypothetical protein [Longimicrobiales bacterium]
MSAQGGMTKADRRELAMLARKRAKLLKAATVERRAEIAADFEAQLASVYTPDDDAAMKRLYMAAQAVVEEARAKLRERCDELGIPEKFAPDMRLEWYRRGENALRERRAELRTVVRTRLDALEKRAKTEIERACVETETRLIADGLTTDAAREFLASMPTPEELMPRFDVSEIAQLLPQHTRERADETIALHDRLQQIGGGES